jgi:prepilin-type N-terminal cleavage/methylation domain-containing protein
MENYNDTGRRGRRRAFTLVELLVVLAIVAVLAGILLPSLNGVRRQAKAVHCASNLKQVATVILLYASDNHGCYPPNDTTISPGAFWYDARRCGQYMNAPGGVSNADLRGPAVTCPEDEGARRSYAMNFWASSRVNAGTLNVTIGGRPWRGGARHASQLILATELWPTIGSPKLGWVAPAYVGQRGDTPGHRFGAGGGLSPLWDTRFGAINCELPYARHRTRGRRGGATEPIGAVNIAYPDGRVELRDNTQLADDAGRSTFDSLWTPDDRLHEK